MKEEFPRDHRISARVSGKTKRKLDNLPYSYGDVLEIGADYLSTEINLLEYQKGELELEIKQIEKELKSKEAELSSVYNRIRLKNPRRLDKAILDSLISEAALDYAQEIYDAHGKDSLEKIKSKVATRSILSIAKDLGYDGFKFMKLVEDHLKNLCRT